MTAAVALAACGYALWRLWRWLDARGVALERRVAFSLLAAAAMLVAGGLVAPVALKAPLLGLGVMLANFGLRRLRQPAPPAGTHPTGGGGRPTTVRTAALEMTLDPDTGAVDGVVLAGRFRGAPLSALSLAHLLELAAGLEDGRSLALLRSYLDAAHPGWQAAEAPGPAGPMARAEALAVLGLSEGADAAAIRAAHNRLMKRVHPDAGGSAELAGRVSRARDTLLGEGGAAG